jgi:preprotein translocase subunit Sec61beta
MTMGSKDKVFMPSSQGGLLRYFDEEQTKIKIKPGHVIVLIGILVAVEIILHAVL